MKPITLHHYRNHQPVMYLHIDHYFFDPDRGFAYVMSGGAGLFVEESVDEIRDLLAE